MKNIFDYALSGVTTAMGVAFFGDNVSNVSL